MTSKQRAYLKSLASKEDTILQIGKEALTPENTAAMERSQRATQTYTSTMASNYATLMEKYDQLKRQWKALKSEHEKNEWIKKNKSAFEELGLSVTNAASAEEVFEKVERISVIN